MKKKYLLILATTAILALSGCANSSSRLSADEGQPKDGEEPAEVVEEVVAPTYMRLDHATAALKINETIQLTPTIRPIEAYNAKFTYSSSASDIASVDANGLVTGLKEGKAIITATSVDDETIVDKCVVYVGAQISTRNKALTVGKMNGKQKSKYYVDGKCVYPDTIRSAMSYKNSIVVDGKPKETFNLFRDIVSSESNAYFSMDTKASFTNTFDAPLMYQNYQYQMLANPGRYDSFIFYTSDSRKNVYYANTGFMADEIDEQGKKLPLMEVVYRLLDSLFSTGRELATDNQERALEEKYLSATQLSEAYGTNEEFLFGNHVEYKDQDFTIGTDQESSYGIPAGTPFKINLSYNIVWEDGACRLYVVNQKMEYELDGKSYVENYRIEYSMSFNEEVGLVLPNVKDYNLVTDLYDL